MGQETIDKDGGYVPTKKQMQSIDRNFDENYASIAATEADVTALQSGDGITLTEYADNAAAVTGGLTLGDLYMTTGAVKVVTA